ncbi:MAG: DUF5106 domain-containing protein [Muribaculaceae bacterium]|mgnify:FL=1|jgi:hypothetical protein|nr:DUF5106 domain-containing protein [Muribaculaceae bacterium]
MNLKRIILGLLLTLSIGLGVKAQNSINRETYFPYPLVPDSIQAFQSRCDYLARHFWDFCELSKAFSAKQKMANEFSVYLSILRNASVDSALASVDRLAKKLEKQPNDLLFLAQQAEGKLFSDTAEAWVDGLYLPFAEAVVKNKRIDKAHKARFAHHATILKNTMMGGPAAPLPYTTVNGEKRNLSADSAEILVVFFNDPDCSDCNLARIRLDADISTTELINEGKVKVVSISLIEPDEAWKQAVSGYPSNWTIGANPDADLTYDLRSGTPNFYIIDRRHNVRFKHLTIDQVLDVMRQIKKR